MMSAGLHIERLPLSLIIIFWLFTFHVKANNDNSLEFKELPQELINSLNSHSKKNVRKTLIEINPKKGNQVLKILENIWNGKGPSNLYHFQEHFKDPVIKLLVAQKLFISGNEIYAEYIKSKAYSRNWKIRANAADALAIVNDQESIELLHEITLTPHQLVALRSLRALEIVYESGENTELVEKVLLRLSVDSDIKDEIVKNKISELNSKILLTKEGNSTENSNIFIPFSEDEIRTQIVDSFYEMQFLAEQGDPSAQHELGEKYMEGIGVMQDIDLGKKWILLSVEQDYAPAKASYAIMLFYGKGVDVDKSKAFKLLSGAIKQGHKPSEELLRILKKIDMNKKGDE